ncbi:hypothetical protein GOBAR_DD17510 [Gossypium barbadense]|nr:hypothetical protein GOBAR_DD17510 [Gossypium barbadense]
MLVDDSNFLAWKQHVLLVLKTHCLLPFVEGTIIMPPQSIAGEDGTPVENSAYARYEQQGSALLAWLLSTISLALHNQSTTKAMRHHVSLKEHQSTILNGLPSKFDHFVSIIMTSRLPFDMHEITSALLDAKARQQAHVSHFSANIVETDNGVSPIVASNLPTYSRKSHAVGHLDRRCYYRDDDASDEDGVAGPNSNNGHLRSSFNGPNSNNGHLPQFISVPLNLKWLSVSTLGHMQVQSILAALTHHVHIQIVSILLSTTSV